LPATAREYTVSRRFRGADYEIHVLNPDGISKGVKSITVDGRPINGNIVPFETGQHRVEVVLGI
ncbi:MAG: hypothetical protein IKX69_06360, partial [Prevotella sp.]|nr:hypothetical protein [Prevotella sp.]